MPLPVLFREEMDINFLREKQGRGPDCWHRKWDYVGFKINVTVVKNTTVLW